MTMNALTLDTILTRWPEACSEGKDWLAAHWPADRAEWTIPEALEAGCDISHAVWLACRMNSTYLRAVRIWGVDCAERVLAVFEVRHFGKQLALGAIDAARRCIDDPSEDNRRTAYAAADTASTTYAASAAAAYAAAADAAYAAAAYAAASAASAARDAAVADPQADRQWQRVRLVELLRQADEAPQP